MTKEFTQLLNMFRDSKDFLLNGKRFNIWGGQMACNNLSARIHVYDEDSEHNGIIKYTIRDNDNVEYGKFTENSFISADEDIKIIFNYRQENDCI